MSLKNRWILFLLLGLASTMGGYARAGINDVYSYTDFLWLHGAFEWVHEEADYRDVYTLGMGPQELDSPLTEGMDVLAGIDLSFYVVEHEDGKSVTLKARTSPVPSDRSFAWRRVIPPRQNWFGYSNFTNKGSYVFFDHHLAEGRELETTDITIDFDECGEASIYLGFAVRDRALGWAELKLANQWGWTQIQLMASGCVTGWRVDRLKVGTCECTLRELPPEVLLWGGLRQTSIYVDGAVAESGDGSSWASPFKTIQEGVDAVRLGGTTVYVKPGVYAPVLVDNAKFTRNNLNYTFTVESTDGPSVTIIDGGEFQFRTDSCIYQSYGCFWYGENPVGLFDILRGFTLRDAFYGGWNGTFDHCIVSNCWYGLSDADADCCLLTANRYGGRSLKKIRNCTIARNVHGGNVIEAANCIVFGNSELDATASGYWYNCCTSVKSLFMENCISADPRFVDARHGDFRLKMGSPCINAGDNARTRVVTDLDGKVRIRRERVDLGAYEHQPTNAFQTISAPVPVDFIWLALNCPSALAAAADDFDQAVLLPSSNPRGGDSGMGTYAIWESYLLGLDPNDAGQTLRVGIEMRKNGPNVHPIPYSPLCVYTVLGKESLTDETWRVDCPNANFLKLRVDVKE